MAGGRQLKEKTYYSVKSFPSTGKTQIPGIICPDFSDGLLVGQLWADFLTSAKVEQDPDRPITVTSPHPIMTYYKFRIMLQPRMIVNLPYLFAILKEIKQNSFASFPIHELSAPQDRQNVSFSATDVSGQKMCIKISYSGKINLLGAHSHGSPQIMHDFFGCLCWQEQHSLIVCRPKLEDTSMHQLAGKGIEEHQQKALYNGTKGAGISTISGNCKTAKDICDEHVARDKRAVTV